MLSKKFLLSLFATASLTALLASCGASNNGKYYDRDGPPRIGGHLRALNASKVSIKVEKPHKAANRPYTVMGKRYYPITGDKPMTQVGTASWYGKQFHGKKTSIGETYDMYELTAAHPTMELPSFAKVTNLKNGRSIIVRVNDRGPFLHGRIIDLSYAAAIKLGYQKEGTARVKVERITRKDIAKGKIPSTNSAGATLIAVASGVKSFSENQTESIATKEQIVAAIPTGVKVLTNVIQETKTQSETKSNSARSGDNTNSQYVSRETVASAQTLDQGSSVSSVILPVDTVGNLIDQTEDRGAPSVSLSFAVEETNSDGQVIDIESPSSSTDIAIGTSGDKITSEDAISAILAEEQVQKVSKKTVVAQKQEKVTPTGDWTVQIGAYSVGDNARAWAAHAETLLDQDDISPVTVVQNGSMYKIFAGHPSSHEKAVEMASRISEKLGIKAMAVERKETTNK